MTIRELAGKSAEELSNLGCHIQGVPVRSIVYDGPGSNCYSLHLGSGLILSAKGHTEFESVEIPRQPKSDDRIRRYGEFGTSI